MSQFKYFILRLANKAILKKILIKKQNLLDDTFQECFQLDI